MPYSFSNEYKKFNIFEEILEENELGENIEMNDDEEPFQDINLFKIPKYLETVSFF